jgi:hypothetical protein
MKISKVAESKTIQVFHGSRQPFDKFDLNQTAQGIIWFTEDINNIINELSGALSNKYILRAEITVSNPAGWEEYDKLFLDQIRQQGFDSIKLDDNWVIFDPDQVRFIQWYKRTPNGKQYVSNYEV